MKSNTTDERYRCAWPGCPMHGNPYENAGWCFWPFYYLWLPEGFYCPVHTPFIKAVFLPLVVEAAFGSLDSDEGQEELAWRAIWL